MCRDARLRDIADMRRQYRFAGKNKHKIAEIGWREAACIIATLAAHNAMPLDDHNGMEYVYQDDDDGMIVKVYPLHNYQWPGGGVLNSLALLGGGQQSVR